MSLLEKLKNLLLLNHFIEFCNYLQIKPSNKYHSFKEIYPKVVIRMKYDKFLDAYKKSLLPNDVSLLDYLNFSLCRETLRVNKKKFLEEFLTKDKNCLENFSDLEKVYFFDLLLDHKFGNSAFFYKTFCEIGIPTIEETQVINLINKLLSGWIDHELKLFHLDFAKKIISFLSEIIDTNFDLLDDNHCIILLEINEKLRKLKLIPPFGSNESKYLDKIETRLVELQSLGNLTNDPEFLSQIMGLFGNLGYIVKNEDLLDYFENTMAKNFKTLNSFQIHKTLIFMLNVYANNPKQKQFLDVFYLQYLKGTQFHLKEYFNRILKIKKFEINFFKNLGLVFSRFFLLSNEIFEPKYFKTVHFDIFHLGDLYYRFGLIDSFNMSNLMVVMRKHIITRIQYVYEYKIRKNINMEYKLHDFWIKILKYYDHQLDKKYYYIFDEIEPTLIFNMALNYSLMNVKYFALEDLMLLYDVMKKFRFSNHHHKKLEDNKIFLLKFFLDERCANLLNNNQIQKFYIQNAPSVLLNSLEQALELEKQNMIDIKTIMSILKETISYLKEYDDYCILKFVQLLETINRNLKDHDFMKTIIEKLISEKIEEVYFIKDFPILSTTLKLFFDFYFTVRKFEKIHPGHFENLLSKLSSSINLLVRKLLFIDADMIDEERLISLLSILKIIEENYLKFNHSISKEFETLSKFCLRFISDRHHKFSYGKLETIIKSAFNLEISSQKFDDGSGLYNKNLIQELDPYIEEKWQKLSEEFRNYWNDLKMKYSE